MNRKIKNIFFMLILYHALLVYAEEKEIKHEKEPSESENEGESFNSIVNKLNEESEKSSIENNLNKNDENSDNKDNTPKDNTPIYNEKIDSINFNSNVDISDLEKEKTISSDENTGKEQNDPLNEPTETRKGVINSEKETIEDSAVDSDKEDAVSGDGDSEDESLKPVEISQVKVIRDNVTGHKRSSFSEEKDENRGDELNASHLKEEAENRILEKEKEKEKVLNEDKGDDEESTSGKDDIEVDEEQPPVEPEVVITSTDELKGSPELSKDEGHKLEETVDEDPLPSENVIANKGGNQEETTAKDDSTEGSFNDFNPKSVPDINIKSAEKAEENFDKGEVPNNNFGQDEFANPGNGLFDSGIKEPPKDSTDIPKAEQDTKTKAKTDISDAETKEGIVLNGKDGSTILLKEELVPEKKEVKTQKKEKKEQPGAKLFEDAMEHLNKKDTNKGLKILAYKLLAEAADINNTDAAEKIAYPYLFGDFIKRNKTKAVELFHFLAAKGNPLGQQGLGFIYGAGLNVNSSQAKALIYTTFAALGGNAMASMMLGYRYLNGIGVAKSCESALTHYKKVAKKVTDETTSHGGNAVQRIRLYDELEQPGGTSGQIDEDLLQYYQFLADKGDLQAQVGLGQLYFQGGRGIDVNYEKAFKYFQLAGDVDNGNGLAYLGKMYLDGLHVEKDQKKAFEYFTKAAEQSNPIGQAGLGMIYLKGAGVKKDYDQAMKYFSQAAEQGWMEGQLQLGNMYYNGIGVKKDYRQAVKYFTFASQSGHVMAFYNLASMHATGAGVMRSCSTATELFKNVAERGKWSMMFMDAYDSYRAGDLETALLKYYYLAELGYEVAQSNVAYVLEKGELSWFPQNQTYARALLQWSRAAHQGYAVARVKVGDYHFYGYGTKIDYDAAALHYRTASDQQNNPQAMFNLGYMHEQGFGLKEDIHLAKRFYDMAAEASPDAHFPVTLALMKLTLFFTWDWMKKNYHHFWEYGPYQRLLLRFQEYDPDWDMFLITVLAVLLGALLLFRRTLRR